LRRINCVVRLSSRVSVFPPIPLSPSSPESSLERRSILDDEVPPLSLHASCFQSIPQKVFDLFAPSFFLRFLITVVKQDPALSDFFLVASDICCLLVCCFFFSCRSAVSHRGRGVDQVKTFFFEPSFLAAVKVPVFFVIPPKGGRLASLRRFLLILALTPRPLLFSFYIEPSVPVLLHRLD